MNLSHWIRLLIIKQQQEETQRIKEEIEKAGAILEQKKS
jgi:hypothetical protein